MNRNLALLAYLIVVPINIIVVTTEFQIVHGSPYTDVDVYTAYNMITNGSYPNIVVLDVRRQDEYDSGHIFGSVWIPQTELEARIDELAGHQTHEIIVYCRSGIRSITASEILDSHNFTNVYNMLGGILAWQSTGYPVWIATVHNLNTTSNYDTIQAATDSAQTLDGHTILVEDGNYTENIKIKKQLTIRSENGPEHCRIGAANSSDYTFEVIADNVTITGFTIAYSDRAGISLQASKSLITNNLVVSNKYYGIYATSSTHSIITNNTIGGNLGWGMYLDSSSNNTISRNNLSRNDFDGLYFWSSDNNVITNNFLDFNLDNGLYFWSSNYNVISNNTLYGNRYYNGWVQNEDGIYLHYSSNNIIVDNFISDNDHYGIWLVVSHNNTITKNVITKNHIGISISTGSNNLICLNNFIDNENNHGDSSANIWNSPSPIPYMYEGKSYTSYLGNYWSDYEGTDTNGDGIGDSPYNIQSDSDHYPLVEKYETYSLHVVLLEITNLSRIPSGDAQPGQEVRITANITDPISGVKNATISYTTTNGTSWDDYFMNYNSTTNLYEAIIPGQPAGTLVKYKIVAYNNEGHFRVDDNSEHYYIYTVIPELSLTSILPLFVIATLLAVTIYKRKHSM